MSGGELDQFNDENATKATSKPITEAWGKDEEDEGEAVCVICDTLFTPKANRPPILCTPCKKALKDFMFTELR